MKIVRRKCLAEVQGSMNDHDKINAVYLELFVDPINQCWNGNQSLQYVGQC